MWAICTQHLKGSFVTNVTTNLGQASTLASDLNRESILMVLFAGQSYLPCRIRVCGPICEAPIYKKAMAALHTFKLCWCLSSCDSIRRQVNVCCVCGRTELFMSGVNNSLSLQA